VSVEEGFAGKSKVPSSYPQVIVERSIGEILRTTDLALLIICQSISYNIMALYMSDIQLPMASFGYDADQRTNAIFAHMLGMFLPSLVSGSVITTFGTWPSTCIGFIIVLLGGGLFYVDNSLLMFTIGITVVGIGWNISFVGPSAALSKVYNKKEKSKVQGFNDGIMLSTIGIFQLSASSIYKATGSNWNIFNAILMGFSILAILMTFVKAVKTTSFF
jgi:MFS family permease